MDDKYIEELVRIWLHLENIERDEDENRLCKEIYFYLLAIGRLDHP